MVETEYFRTGSKKGRGRAQKSDDLIQAMYEAAEPAQPITGRGIGYKLFSKGLIPSMATGEMAKVYRLLRIAREEDIIPWPWIVDETRELEKRGAWRNLGEYVGILGRAYRRDFWNEQPTRVEVWSEKGTVRGVLQPVLDQYGVGFRVMHGFGSATAAYDVAQDCDGRDLVALYVGDFDPSGMFMSEEDLPKRLEKYEGYHVNVTRVAITRDQTNGLLSFPAADTRATSGSWPTTARSAGNSTRWTPTTCAMWSRRRSGSRSMMRRGAAARRSTRPRRKA
jgi:hypothetical protein